MIRLPWRPRDPEAPGAVAGERATPIVRGARSLQSRMSSILAAVLMSAVGGGMLAWYYAEALSHPARRHRQAQPPLLAAPGAGMTLPPFGSAPSLPRPRPALAAPHPASLADARAAQIVDPSAGALSESPLLGPPLTRAPGQISAYAPGAAGASPPQRALERRLSGSVFTAAQGTAVPRIAPDQLPAAAGVGGGHLQSLLHPGVLAATPAQRLPSQRLLLPMGSFIDCTLETAIDSTLPGMTTCVTASDTFSADGTVVLLERGTKLIGQTRGEVRQGQARVFVVWTQARTPAGVVVRLDSPGTDALGRSGLAGKVDRHFWERFGAAALVSTLDGVVQSEVQSSSRGGTVVLDPSASEDVLTGILRSTIDIPPTIRVSNGARIQVLVARDVDFRSVYELDPR